MATLSLLNNGYTKTINQYMLLVIPTLIKDIGNARTRYVSTQKGSE